MNHAANPLLNETFIFRPLKNHSGMLRYADGKWIPDDGQPDLAFIHYDQFPVVEYISMPYYTNLLWEWWELQERKRVWHYCTTNNQDRADYRFEERDKHPNEIAGRSGMNKCCDLYHCANGQSIHIDSDNEYINLEKLIIQSNGKPVTKQENPICFLCLNNNYGHRLRELQSEKGRLESDIEIYGQEIKDHEVELYDTKHALDKTKEALVELEQTISATVKG